MDSILHSAEPTAPGDVIPPGSPAEEMDIGDELLVEEVSIDGMCGVY